MVGFFLEYKVKGLKLFRSEINLLFFGDVGGFFIIYLESIDFILVIDIFLF